jgi:hypothetical protein
LVLYKLHVLMYKKVSYPKQKSLLALHIFVLLGHLTQVFTLSGNSLPNFFPRRLPGFLPESLPESYPSVLPGALPESNLDMYPIG